MMCLVGSVAPRIIIFAEYIPANCGVSVVYEPASFLYSVITHSLSPPIAPIVR